MEVRITASSGARSLRRAVALLAVLPFAAAGAWAGASMAAARWVAAAVVEGYRDGARHPWMALVPVVAVLAWWVM